MDRLEIGKPNVATQLGIPLARALGITDKLQGPLRLLRAPRIMVQVTVDQSPSTYVT